MNKNKETVKGKIWRTSWVFEQAIRIVGMQFILAPAAYLLPRNLAMAIADAVALILIILPTPGLGIYRKMRSVFGNNRPKTIHLAWKWLARPFRDFVVAKRVVAGREIRSDLRVVEHNSESISSLRKSGESYIIALGHFAREAVGALYLPCITLGHLVIVSVPLPRHNGCLDDLRTRLQLRTLLEATRAIHLGNETFVFTKSKQPASGKLYALLRKPGNAAIINLDAPVKGCGPGFVLRDFAGHKKHALSIGAIKLARLSGCAIIGCVCYVRKDGVTVIEWGDAIRPSEDWTKSEDLSAMNEIVDKIEIAIGKRPEQYVLDIGDERRWDARRGEWVDLCIQEGDCHRDASWSCMAVKCARDAPGNS